jgi:hypothetical protein
MATQRSRLVLPQTGFRFAGLLDLFPNSQLAISTRLLRANLYNEWLWQIRRNSDNDAALVKADLTLSTPAISLNSQIVNSSTTLGQFVGSNSGFVVVPKNQGLDATSNPSQSDITKQPRIVNNGVLDTKNGKPTIVFSNSYFTFNIANLTIQASGYVGTLRINAVSYNSPLCLRKSLSSLNSNSDFSWGHGTLAGTNKINTGGFCTANLALLNGSSINIADTNYNGFADGQAVPLNTLYSNFHQSTTTVFGAGNGTIGADSLNGGRIWDGTISEVITHTTAIDSLAGYCSNINSYFGLS